MELRHCVGCSVLLLSIGFGASMLSDPSPGHALFPIMSGTILFTVVWVGLEHYHVPVPFALFAANALLAVCYFVFSMPNRALCVGAFVLLHMAMVGLFVRRVCTPKAKVIALPLAQETRQDATEVAVEVPTRTALVID